MWFTFTAYASHTSFLNSDYQTKLKPQADRPRYLSHGLRHPLVPDPLQLLDPLPRAAPRLGRLHASRRRRSFHIFFPLFTNQQHQHLRRHPRRPTRDIRRPDRRHARDLTGLGFRERDEGADVLDTHQGRRAIDAGREGGVEGETEEAVERSWACLLVCLFTPPVPFLPYSSLCIVPARCLTGRLGAAFLYRIGIRAPLHYPTLPLRPDTRSSAS